MLSASQFRACNFLIGKNFNTLRSQFPAADSASLRAFLKLEIPLTVIKSTTSRFLIDNLNGFSMKPFTLSASEGSRPPQHVAVNEDRTSNLKSPTSSSNRPSPRLEISVSHRKQRIAPVSNRPNFAVIKFPVPRSRAESALRHELEVVRAHGLERYFASGGIVRARQHDVSSLFFRRPSC